MRMLDMTVEGSKITGMDETFEVSFRSSATGGE